MQKVDPMNALLGSFYASTLAATAAEITLRVMKSHIIQSY
jgi:hypothetical protein